MKRVEKRLYDVIVEFMTERGHELAVGPLNDLIIPIKGSDELRVPMLLLVNA